MPAASKLWQNAPTGTEAADLVMSTVVVGEVMWVEAETPVAEVARMMRAHAVAVVPVARGGRLIGVVTDRDLVLKVLAKGRDPATTRACEVLNGGTVRFENGGRTRR